MRLEWSLSLAVFLVCHHSVLNYWQQLFTWNKSPKFSETYFSGDTLAKWIMGLGCLHDIFQMKARPHLTKTELPTQPLPMQPRWTVIASSPKSWTQVSSTPTCQIPRQTFISSYMMCLWGIGDKPTVSGGLHFTMVNSNYPTVHNDYISAF
jgi:hypothetical protein